MRHFLFFGISLFVGCTQTQKSDQTDQLIQIVTNLSTDDSLTMVNTKEFARVREFLNWYKIGYKELNMPSIEKYIETDTLFYAYVDDTAAQQLLIKYRQSGFFSEDKLIEDSTYIEEAKTAYEGRDLEIYDYFDHDFVLLTQEIESTLNAIPNTYIIPQLCNIESGIVAVSIGGQMNLSFSLIRENGELKIQRIENLGQQRKSL